MMDVEGEAEKLTMGTRDTVAKLDDVTEIPADNVCDENASQQLKSGENARDRCNGFYQKSPKAMVSPSVADA